MKAHAPLPKSNPFLSRRHFAAFCALGTITWPLARTHAQASGPHTVTDCRGRTIVLGNFKKIVCIGGTITETLYTLNTADKIIAIDTTSTWPEKALQEKKSVGYMRALSSEGILALQPDLILCMNNAGPAPALDQLLASSIPIVFVDATPTPQAIEGRTKFLANIVGQQAAGQQLADGIAKKFQELAEWRAQQKTMLRVLFVMRMSNNRPMAAGTETAANAIIQLAGGINAASGMQGYKVLDQESLIQLKPDAILVMAQNNTSIRDTLLNDPGFKLTPAGKNHAIIAIEGQRLLGFGPRTPEAALELAHQLNTIGKPA